MRARSGKLIVYAKGFCETMLHPASNGSVRSGNIWPPKHPRVPVSVPRPDQGEHHDPEYVAQLLTQCVAQLLANYEPICGPIIGEQDRPIIAQLLPIIGHLDPIIANYWPPTEPIIGHAWSQLLAAHRPIIGLQIATC